MPTLNETNKRVITNVPSLYKIVYILVIGKAPKEILLRKWEIGRFADSARIKAGDMIVDGLERLIDEFPESLGIVKPL